MNTYLMRLCSYHQPRRVRVLENVLANRQTVANLFWAQQYGLLNWLGARREASRGQLDYEINKLQTAGLVERTGQDAVQLTAAGVSYQEEHPVNYQPYFYQWYWLANTRRVQRRLLLACQVVSEFAYHQRAYAPISVPFADQQAVRNWFHHYFSAQLPEQVYSELHLLVSSLESEDRRLAPAFVNLLIGHQQNGWTIDQLCQQLGLTIADGQVMRHDLLLAVSAFAKQTTGPIACLLKPLLAGQPLSASCQRSVQMVQQGVELPTIAKRRHLKLSTVREHLLTAAILTPQSMEWLQLIPAADRQWLSDHYSGQASSWRFASWSTDSDTDFYYFRLYQICQGKQRNDD